MSVAEPGMLLPEHLSKCYASMCWSALTVSLVVNYLSRSFCYAIGYVAL